jgi:menaquinone-dependent protoporphyrinogen oxidase
MRLLVAYATTDGMTARIAERVAETARYEGHDAQALDVAHLPPMFDAGTFDAILLGASVHSLAYQRAARRFIKNQLAALKDKPSGFFSVCMAAASNDATDIAEAHTQAEDFPRRHGWSPDTVEVIAGALSFSHYGFLRGPLMRAVARREHPDVDPHHDHEFTDWIAVERFVRRFLELAAAWPARPSAPSRPQPSPEPSPQPG